MRGARHHADRQAREIERRVMNVIPATQYAFDTLLKLLDVVVTTEVPTAAVRCGAVPVLLVNPEFVDEWCREDEALFTLIMHELHHVLLGHTRLFSRATQAHNFAFDAVINSHLAHLFPSPAHTSLFTRFYAAERAPEFLLRPPPGWPAKPDWSVALRARIPERLCALHRRIYSETGVTYDELFAELVEVIPLLLDGDGPSLLGDHDGPPEGSDGDKLLLDALRTVVEKWPTPATDGRDRGLGSAVAQALVPRVPSPRSARAVVRQAFRFAATGTAGPLARHLGEIPVVVPIPDLGDRRAIVARCLGAVPLLYQSHACTPRSRHGGRVHLYLDVSGSVEGFLPELYAALRPFAASLYPQVHLFSTQIRDVRVSDLARGVRLSDGGTAIGPVIEHLLTRRVGRALLVTDGLVGKVSPPDQALLRKRGVALVVLLTPRGSRTDLEPVTSRFFQLPTLETR